MLDASTSASNSSSEICGGGYLYILPTESLDVPELPLVNCVWILRVRKHDVGWDKGLDSLRSSYLGLHGGVQVLETCLTPVACHLLPSLFWPAFYELIVRWFSHLESPPPYYPRRGSMREGRPPLKEQSLHELTLHTNWTHVVLLPSNPFSSLFYFFLPCLGVTCSSVARYRTLSFLEHFTFIVCLSFIWLYSALGAALLVSTHLYIYFVQKWKSKSLQSSSY